jgi:hypothetical protein
MHKTPCSSRPSDGSPASLTATSWGAATKHRLTPYSSPPMAERWRERFESRRCVRDQSIACHQLAFSLSCYVLEVCSYYACAADLAMGIHDLMESSSTWQGTWTGETSRMDLITSKNAFPTIWQSAEARGLCQKQKEFMNAFLWTFPREFFPESLWTRSDNAPQHHGETAQNYWSAPSFFCSFFFFLSLWIDRFFISTSLYSKILFRHFWVRLLG